MKLFRSIQLNSKFFFNIFISKLLFKNPNHSLYFSLKSTIFEKVTEEILELFPNESSEVYFVPYQPPKIGQRKQAPRGKLWSRFIHLKVGLRLAEKFSTPTPLTGQSPEDPSDEAICHLNLLKSDATDFPRLFKAWIDYK